VTEALQLWGFRGVFVRFSLLKLNESTKWLKASNACSLSD